MATFISDNQKFHIFSKSPVRANMELFQATNKSGHTIISEEVRTDDIPWFINVPDVNNPPSYVKNPRKNDIIFQGKFNSLSTAVVCKTWDGEKWVDGPNLKENPILENENGDDVIQVHFENDIEYVSDTNNAGTTSDKQAAFVLKTNGEMLTHFVSPTDKIYNGIPSNGYGLYLFLDSQLQSETDSNDSGYIANSYAGIIQFNKARTEIASKFKVITFEYIGGYLSKSLNKIEDGLKDYIDEEIKEHNKEFIAHKNNQNSEKHLSQSEVDGLNTLTSANKISSIETATQYDYQAAADLSKALSATVSTPNTSDSTFKNVTIKLHLRDKVLQQSTMPVTSKAIYNHVHKQSVNIEKASDNVTVEEVTTNENERRKYTIAVDGYTTSETDNIVEDIYEKIQATTDDINKNVVEHTSNNEIHITDTERVSWNNNEVVLQKHLNDQNSHVSDEDREKWATNDNLSSHTSNNVIHITADEREKWNKGGNMSISGDNFITSEKTDTGWNLALNNSTVVGSSIVTDGDKKVPTVNAVTNRVNNAITLHERTKKHLDFNEISFALSGGHLINEVSNEIKESPKYIFEYTEDETINPSEINYTGLTINNKSSLKGLNAFFKKLTIKKVQPINASNLYAHISRSAEKVVSTGALQNKEYILTLEADITVPGEITLNFGNKLIISKEYWYGIEFTESNAIPSTTSPEVILSYNNFANVNYDPTANDPSYPSLVTNKVLEGTQIEGITYNIPCVMEFEDYEVPTSNAVINYVDDTRDENGEIIKQGILTKWHIENEYFHMQKSVVDKLKSFNLDNYGVGDRCKGVIMKLPYLSKIKSISLVAVTADAYNRPDSSKAMTWSNYRLKIVDTLSGQVLATSEIGKNANSTANNQLKGYPIGLFDFVDSNTVINQIYCDAEREYQILFVDEAGETAIIELAYANGNGNYSTYENYIFGEFSPKVILSDGTIKEHPSSFSVALQPPVNCKGYACDFAVDTVKSEELTHLSKQIGELKNYIAYMNASINQLKS